MTLDDVPAGTAAARRARLFEDLVRRPWDYDFFATLRRVDALTPDSPRLGAAPRPRAEALRLGQDAELEFAPAAQMNLTPGRDGVPPRLGVRFFGLFGPMGALPLHLTEYARDRTRHHGDRSFAAFADVFHHRMLLLFYRAWAQAQPAVQADRPDDDRFARWLAALFGHGAGAMRGADRVPDTARCFHAGGLARATRNVETMERVLTSYFDMPVRIETHVGHWLTLPERQRTRLGSPAAPQAAPLGIAAVTGRRVWDRQYLLRLHFGPLELAQYLRLLPGQRALIELRDWLRQLLGFEMLWDLRLVLHGTQVPPLRIGRGLAPALPLGHCTWLGSRRPQADRGDLRLNPARTPRRARGEGHG